MWAMEKFALMSTSVCKNLAVMKTQSVPTRKDPLSVDAMKDLGEMEILKKDALMSMNA